MVQAYFDDIKNVIANELKMAKQSIYVAVAWFTDRELFAILTDKAKEGVKVYLCITDDSINTKSELPYEELFENGGYIHKLQKVLMHNKYCVIDEKDIITGSYNWTYSASKNNIENIIITTGDISLALRYINEFNRITGRKSELQVGGNNLSKLINRIELIKRLISLSEQEDIEKHALRLREETDDEKLLEIADTLLLKKFTNGVNLINQFIGSYSKIIAWIDPEIDAIKLEISGLQNIIVAVENEIAEAETIVRKYRIFSKKYIGDIVEEILKFKREIAFKEKDESDFNRQKYEESEERYNKYKNQNKEADTLDKETFIISDAEKIALKRNYNTAVLLCHPDKVDEKHKKDAEKVFNELKIAYQRQDIIRVEEIVSNVKQGIFNIEVSTTTNLDLLRNKLAYLISRRVLCMDALVHIKGTHPYKISMQEPDLDPYFEKLKENYQKELETLIAENGQVAVK